jgi:small conductance mechanosensitive channel
MSTFKDVYPMAIALLPAFAVAILVAILLWASDRILLHRLRVAGEQERFSRQLVMLALTTVGVVLVVLSLPVSDTMRGQLLGLLGLALTAVIALASTTFVTNVMAGLMLRSVGNFRPGDFVKVGDHFGRVTTRGLFHTEIQTVDRDLTTLPNLYLVSHPVTVVRSSGTIISCEVSLGYDNAHATIEPLFLEAAGSAKLDDAYVHVMELGNFAVTYRVAGFLSDVNHLLSARSRLRAAILDSLHGAGVEIMSPTFMAQRQVEPGTLVIPEGIGVSRRDADAGPTAEEMAFDKAEQAGRLEEMRLAAEALLAEADRLEKELGEAPSDERGARKARIKATRARAEALRTRLTRASEEQTARTDRGEGEQPRAGETADADVTTARKPQG